MKLISFEIKSDFGFLKKPDINEGIYLTFNMLHKPALLGILGAIVGLKGYREFKKIPEYYVKLKNIKLGIIPLDSDKGNFNKTVITYNNSVGYASKETGGNLIVTEQTLIKPSFRCYLELNEKSESEKVLYEYLGKYEAVFLPYLGKNEFSIWWEDIKELEYEKLEPQSSFKIDSVFYKNTTVKDKVQPKTFSLMDIDKNTNGFIYFERLPIKFSDNLDMYQYEYEDFVYTNFEFKKGSEFEKLYKLSNNEIIQLF